ncbi:hypothetical protein OM213_17620, partial [Escherichia albertii]|nr:hypothetical protein [Escherichia albertii]
RAVGGSNPPGCTIFSVIFSDEDMEEVAVTTACTRKDNVASATARRENASESSSRMRHLLQKFPSKNLSFLNNYFLHFLNILLLRHQRQNQAITLK